MPSTHLRVPPFADREDRRSACCTDLVLLVLEASLEALKAVTMGTVLWSNWLLTNLCKSEDSSKAKIAIQRVYTSLHGLSISD
jgi:hypothetical protein